MQTQTPNIRSCFDVHLLEFLPILSLLDTDVAWHNIHFKPDVTKIYLQVHFMPGQTAAASLGTDGFERVQGIYQIDVNVPMTTGISVTEHLCLNLVDYFRGGKKLKTCNNHEVTITTAYYGTAQANKDRLVTPITIMWRAYVQKD